MFVKHLRLLHTLMKLHNKVHTANYIFNITYNLPIDILLL